MDTRYWSFFLYLIAAVMFLCGFATPYSMIGNRISIQVAFGGNVLPESNADSSRIGLWGEISSELVGTFTAVRTLLCIAVVLLVFTLIGYILLFLRQNTIIQVLAILAQLLAGLFAIIGIAVYRSASAEMGEGFWLCAMSGGIFILNGIILMFLPVMEDHMPAWQGKGAHIQLKRISLRKGSSSKA